ncbi:UDP-glucuronosyltransferase 1-2-like [Chanos chanos]|uniref:UDP-glucuronosyltransferase 1-2-like n=1 Tax=Chanos chanos TaxID=29144 RepID=A0A6J2WBW0_CHACN|nr:UDP-glucuronosyltransferase 1-2-like [Chanos chanos]
MRGFIQGVLLYLICLGSTQAGKLLVIPADGSHWMGMKPLVEELGRRGHEVVVVIPEESLSMGPSEHTTTLTFPVPFTKAQLQEDLNVALQRMMLSDLSTDLAKFQNFLSSLKFLSKFTMMTETLLHNKELLQKLKDWDFDALITDPFQPVGVIVGEYLSIPSIYVQANMPCGAEYLATNCPTPSSYVPQRDTHYNDHMTFWQRSINFFRTMVQPLACATLYEYADVVATRFLQREASVVEIMSRAALWLNRVDFTFEYPHPQMPNMIMIGGFDHRTPKPLPAVSF